MTKKPRVILTVATMELMLAGLWFHLAQNGITHPDRVSPDFQQTIGSTMGMAMGAFLGFGLLMLFVAAKNDRAASRGHDA